MAKAVSDTAPITADPELLEITAGLFTYRQYPDGTIERVGVGAPGEEHLIKEGDDEWKALTAKFEEAATTKPAEGVEDITFGELTPDDLEAVAAPEGKRPGELPQVAAPTPAPAPAPAPAEDRSRITGFFDRLASRRQPEAPAPSKSPVMADATLGLEEVPTVQDERGGWAQGSPGGAKPGGDKKAAKWLMDAKKKQKPPETPEEERTY